MMYKIKSIFYTIQGEGYWAGTPAVFCRFAGCDLECGFCDTDFEGGKTYSGNQLVHDIQEANTSNCTHVVLTGGEPALQVNVSLIQLLQEVGLTTHIETHGGHPLPHNLDWICVSPKTKKLVVMTGDEIKVLYPAFDPHAYTHLNFKWWSIQPVMDKNYKHNLQASIDFCMKYPKWHLSTQQHKQWGVL